ncbi:hypothetical protein ACU686_41290 [Yinghuangia aomiensis]
MACQTRGQPRRLPGAEEPPDRPPTTRGFGAEIRARALGTPLPAVRGPDALPWVRFDRSADGTANTVTWTEWSAFLDEFGRPIVGTSHYVLPGVDLALHRPALDELMQALFGIDLAEHPPQPALLTLPAPGEPQGGSRTRSAGLPRSRRCCSKDRSRSCRTPRTGRCGTASGCSTTSSACCRIRRPPRCRRRRGGRRPRRAAYGSRSDRRSAGGGPCGSAGPPNRETAAGDAYRRLVLALAEARGAVPLSRDLRAPSR